MRCGKGTIEKAVDLSVLKLFIDNEPVINIRKCVTSADAGDRQSNLPGLIIVWVTSQALFLHEGHEGIQWPWNNGLSSVFSVPPWGELFAVAETLIVAQKCLPGLVVAPSGADSASESSVHGRPLGVERPDGTHSERTRLKA